MSTAEGRPVRRAALGLADRMTVSGHCAFPSGNSHQFCGVLVNAGTLTCKCECHAQNAGETSR